MWLLQDAAFTQLFWGAAVDVVPSNEIRLRRAHLIDDADNLV
jgi:hypothetical protein